MIKTLFLGIVLVLISSCTRVLFFSSAEEYLLNRNKSYDILLDTLTNCSGYITCVSSQTSISTVHELLFFKERPLKKFKTLKQALKSGGTIISLNLLRSSTITRDYPKLYHLEMIDVYDSLDGSVFPDGIWENCNDSTSKYIPISGDFELNMVDAHHYALAVSDTYSVKDFTRKEKYMMVLYPISPIILLED